MGNTIATATDLQTQLNAADAKTDLKALAQMAISILAERENDISDLNVQLTESLDQVTELGSKLDLQEKTKDVPGIVVSVNGANKMLIGNRFRINKADYTAKQVADTPALLAILVERNSGSLVDPPASVTEGSTSTNTES